jgi:hypothetical protein
VSFWAFYDFAVISRAWNEKQIAIKGGEDQLELSVTHSVLQNQLISTMDGEKLEEQTHKKGKLQTGMAGRLKNEQKIIKKARQEVTKSRDAW